MKQLTILSILFILFSCQEKTEEITVTNPEAKMLFGVEITDTPTDNVQSLRKTTLYVYTNATSKDELCSSKSLLSDIAYEEIWIIQDKNDPMQNRSRKSLKEVDAQDVLDKMCNNVDNAVYTLADMEKFGKYKQEYKAFFD